MAYVFEEDKKKTEAKDALLGLKSTLLDMIYPVGSIYMSVRNVNPQTLFGGTWVAWGAGKAVVGVNTGETEFNTVEKTGGAKTHTLTTAQLPAHKHSASTGGAGGHAHSVSNLRHNTGYKSAGGGGIFFYETGTGTLNTSEVANHTHSVSVGNTGSGSAHNNLQPYITCYMWKRTA